MPIPGAHYATVRRGRTLMRYAYRGAQMVEAKNVKTGATHTPAEFAADRRRTLLRRRKG